MLRVIGGLMVIAATGSYGLSVARRYATRPRELRSLEGALAMLETEIAYGATPLLEAFESLHQRSDRLVSPLFVYAIEELMDGNGRTVADAWENALRRFQAGSSLRSEDILILSGLGPVLGGSGREDQVRHIRLTVQHLKNALGEAEAEAARNVRLWQYLGFLGGLAVVVILL